jgi:hypothetical protein
LLQQRQQRTLATMRMVWLVIIWWFGWPLAMRPENWGLFCVPAIFHFHEESFPRTPITMLNMCNSTACVGEQWPILANPQAQQLLYKTRRIHRKTSSVSIQLWRCLFAIH